MQKWLALLLLMITTAGTVIPCCLVDDCKADQAAVKTPGGRQEGHCSPFFACASCAGFVEVSKPIQIIHVTIEKQAHHPVLVISDLATYASSFWQPPRCC